MQYLLNALSTIGISKNMLLAGIGVIGALLGFLTLQSAYAGNIAPLLGCTALVVNVGVIYFALKKG